MLWISLLPRLLSLLNLFKKTLSHHQSHKFLSLSAKLFNTLISMVRGGEEIEGGKGRRREKKWERGGREGGGGNTQRGWGVVRGWRLW